jgi:NADH dehydrogenase FAD-containing subunit
MRLAIIGGGFCGAMLAREFKRRKDVEVMLFDRKSYFEFTPGILKWLIEWRVLRRCT